MEKTEKTRLGNLVVFAAYLDAWVNNTFTKKGKCIRCGANSATPLCFCVDGKVDGFKAVADPTTTRKRAMEKIGEKRKAWKTAAPERKERYYATAMELITQKTWGTKPFGYWANQVMDDGDFETAAEAVKSTLGYVAAELRVGLRELMRNGNTAMTVADLNRTPQYNVNIFVTHMPCGDNEFSRGLCLAMVGERLDELRQESELAKKQAEEELKRVAMEKVATEPKKVSVPVKSRDDVLAELMGMPNRIFRFTKGRSGIYAKVVRNKEEAIIWRGYQRDHYGHEKIFVNMEDTDEIYSVFFKHPSVKVELVKPEAVVFLSQEEFKQLKKDNLDAKKTREAAAAAAKAKEESKETKAQTVSTVMAEAAVKAKAEAEAAAKAKVKADAKQRAVIKARRAAKARKRSRMATA